MALNGGVPTRSGLNPDPRVDTIRDIVTTDLGHCWTVPELSQRVNLSPSRLRHLFVVQMGVPPLRYLRELRLREASRLLEFTHLKIKEIMWRVGITDGSHFVRNFATMFGVSPKKYRRSKPILDDRRNGQHSGEIASCDNRVSLATTRTPSVIESQDNHAPPNSRRRLVR